MYRFTAGAAVILGFAVTLGAQAEHKPMPGAMEKGAMKNVMVTGCVAESGGMYMLDHAMMTADMKKTKKDDMSANSKMMSYALMGGELKAHVGHKVEVTGTMAPGDMSHSKMDEGAMNKDSNKDSMGAMKAGTLNVKSVKMISASCS